MKNANRHSRRRFVISAAVAWGGLLAGCTTPRPGGAASTHHYAATTTNSYLQITLNVKAENRAAAAGVYAKYKQPFLESVRGAQSKELLIRDEDVQVLHGFASEEEATTYLSTELFGNDIVGELKALLEPDPEVRIGSVAH